MKTMLPAILTLLITITSSAVGQQPPPPTLEEVVNSAELRSKEYVETFKNLIAEETKSFVIYNKDGAEKKRRSVRSLFLVYPLTKDPDRVIEFRNVLSVDGKVIGNADKRTQDFFQKVTAAESSEKEIDRLNDESLRFDDPIAISGLTLFQAVVLDSRLRPFFKFELGPASQIDGRLVFSVTYQQLTDTPEIAVNPPKGTQRSTKAQHYEVEVDKDVPLNARMSGTLSIDAETFQLRGESRQITIQPAGFIKPLTVIDDRFEFQDSTLGILTPKKVIHTQFKALIKDQRVVKLVQVTFEYGKFSKPDVEVKTSEIKP